jgi:ribosomal protein S18 acetylase RimI-like enzyme
MLIRQLHPADWEAYRTIRLEALGQAPEAFGSDYAESSQRPPDTWVAGVSDPYVIVLGAFADGGEIVGMAVLARERRIKTRHKATVNGVYVSPAARRTGCAKALVTELINRARATGEVEQLLLAVVSENAGARALYEHLGFQVYGREPRALKLGERYLDEDLMVLDLPR